MSQRLSSEFEKDLLLAGRFVLFGDVPGSYLVSQLPPQMLLYQTLLTLDQQSYT